jgi:D-arabinitol 2-dehydrogenase
MTGRNQPTTWCVQRRSITSHRDVTCQQVPYEKDENVGVKKFGQFDLEGKVFVVTGTTAKVS